MERARASARCGIPRARVKMPLPSRISRSAGLESLLRSAASALP